jgi:hypothetical protein
MEREQTISLANPLVTGLEVMVDTQVHIWNLTFKSGQIICGMTNPNIAVSEDQIRRLSEQDICPICLKGLQRNRTAVQSKV